MKNKSFFALTVILMLCALALCACGRESAEVGNCSLSISCETLLANKEVVESLSADKKAILPQDGIVLAETEIGFLQDETVLAMVKRYFTANKLHIDISEDSFIQGIANIYNGDAGGWSGWFFFINGECASVGANEVVLKDGDRVEFKYSCDCGPDLGLTW